MILPKPKSCFWGLVYENRTKYTMAVVFAVFAYLSGSTIAFIIKVFIDYILLGNEEHIPAVIKTVIDFAGGRFHVRNNLWLVALAVVVLAFLMNVFMHLTIRTNASACVQIIKVLRDTLFNTFQFSDDRFFAKYEAGNLIQRSTSDIGVLVNFLSTQLSGIGQIIIQIVMIGVVMCLIDIKMTLLTMSLIPIIMLVVWHYVRVIIRRSFTVQAAEADLTNKVQENLSGIRVVRAFAAQKFESSKFSEKIQKHYDATIHRWDKYGSFFAITTALSFLQLAFVFLGGSWMVIHQHISIGTFAAFIYFVITFTFTFRTLGGMLTELGGAIVSIARVDEVLRGRFPDTPAVDQPNGYDLTGKIEFKNVCVSYQGQDNVLDQVSFLIKPGETIAIVGPSGSGKSTIVETLLKNIEYHSGSILIDNEGLHEIDARVLRSQIGVSLQETFLFSKTIQTNIKIVNKHASDKEMMTAAREARIHDSIQAFPHRYETQVGEQGVRLSGGQRQRLSLARALLKKPAVLVLDDSLNAVDVKTESEILRNLYENHRCTTTILVTNRLSFCINADSILVMENGKLTAKGNHSELIAKEGFYRNLWKIQKEIELAS